MRLPARLGFLDDFAGIECNEFGFTRFQTGL
jgi:hypothetical protein